MSDALRLMHYNPGWLQEFEQTKSSLLFATQGWLVGIEHIGSTAIKDGIARPVVDVLAGMSSLQGLNEAALLIEGLNYARLETPSWCEEELCAYLEKPRSGAATHSVLLVRHEGILWQQAMGLRDILANNLELWQRFQTLKQDNFTAGCTALKNYSDAKDKFFAELRDEHDL